MSLNYGKDYTGLKFGHLTVTSFFPTEENRGSWLCECDCGNKNVVVHTSDLYSGIISSCGCRGYPDGYKIIKASSYTYIDNEIIYDIQTKLRMQQFYLQKIF